MSRVSVDEVGLLVARAWALRATCPRRQVGCVLMDAAGFVLSTGYNGPPSGQPHCTEEPCPGAGMTSGQGLNICEAVHAEANALLRCDDVTRIYTCCVTTSPCLACVKLLLNTGCRRIVFIEEYVHGADARARWVRPDNGVAAQRSSVKAMLGLEIPAQRTWSAYGKDNFHRLLGARYA